MIKKKWLKIALAVFVFLAVGTAGTFIEHFEQDRFVIETVTDKAEVENASADVSGVTEDGRININAAPADELIMLDGIGEKLAQRIIDYRTEHGDFGVIEEIALVSGISDKTVERLRDKICVK